MARSRTCNCGVCKKCKQREYQQRWAAKQDQAWKDRQLAYKRRWYANMTPEQRFKFNAEHAAYRKREDPRARFARKLIREAIQQGRMIRGQCEICGKPDAEAHHDDYDKPFDVRWLCTKHHRAVDRGD